MPPFLLSLSLPALTLPLPPAPAPAPRRHRVFAAPAYGPQPCRGRVCVCAAYRPPPRQPYRRQPAPAPAPDPRPRPSNAPAPPQRDPRGQEEVEEAIYDFMRRSDKPGAFPTRAELLAAGRADLAAAVESSGGWLSLGWSWSSDDDARRPAASSAGPGVHPDYPPEAGPSGRPPNSAADSVREQQEPTRSGRQPETEETEEAGSGAGLEGMLARLRRERERARPPPRSKNQAGGQGQNGALMNHNGAPSRSPTDGMYTRRIPVNGNIHRSHSQNGIPEANKSSSSANDAWRTWSLDKSRFSDFEAAEIHPLSRKPPKRADLDTVLIEDDVPGPSNGVVINDYPSDHVDSERDEIHARFQNLEFDLADSLKTLRSRFDGVSSYMSNGEEADVVNGFSDDWEFEETKVMHAQEELRTIRAKIAVLEGKVALEIIEKNKIIEEKQTRLDEVEKALSELRTVSVVWPNPASEVLLTGSFDGWTSQRRMEQSESGIFSYNLRLYPGRYEIKFIVDGVWKNDPLRPTVNNHGNENNLMIVT
ncbi:protein FLOURY ENDOSPERM 6, chloroplastic isoform X1 [Aegilops tauschii subsp. strangulata]|uniref:AMP-activated protein kinase glycogen-binding domain-containing protein n=3 Tax=Aegilops TaxID=4480 RepID=A0A453H2B2_AEGTS|nr:protein FLOURY ENDOSPERM 6, chloroplastic isoform X1 [Aegilops tauschii subsp. strangulata]XP_044373205.1 protein FLOURY ENDOSPERM 6, chloroplastic-like isoform X1 [Triticum aestivum]